MSQKNSAFGNVKLEPQSQEEAGAGSDAVGRLVDSSQADDRKMIRLVRQRRLLYARNNMPVASYHSQVKHLWQEVANEMGWTVADVRRKWSHIRNSYSRHLRNEMHGAITAKGRTVSRWYLADELAFLREHMATDMRASPYSSSFAPTFLEMDLGGEAAESKPPLGGPWFALGGRAPDPDDSSSSAFDGDETSSYFQFFRGLHPEYLELSARRQRQFRRQCLAALHQLLDDEERQREAAGTRSAPASDDDDARLCVVSAVSGAPAAILPHAI